MLRRRLPLSSVIFFGAAVVCGVLAVVLMRGYARRLQTTRPDAGPPVPVVVAAQDLVRGTVLSDQMVRQGYVPSAFKPPRAEGSVADVTGKVLAADVTAGEIVTAARLAGSSVGPVAAVVPPGLRAVIVSSGLPMGTVRAGDVVDVLAAFGGGRSHVETVAEGLDVARVLPPQASNGVAGTGDPGPTLVLVVDPSTAEQLAYAAAFAKLTVTIEPAPTPVPTATPSISP
jgi:pilus assembly protein CpaB